MDRRNFMKAAGAIGAAPLIHSCEAAPREERAGAPKALMHVGSQRGPTTRELLQFHKRHGVDHICGYPPMTADRRWEVPELIKLRELCESEGVSLDVMPLPLPSTNVNDKEFQHIFTGKSPERDREIDLICDMIRASAEAGIPCLKYNLTVLEVLRTERTPGRGGSSYSTWVWEKRKKDQPLTIAGEVPADVFWERITYFLERVVPVAEEHKIRLACHQHDPGIPKEGYRGVDRVLGTVEGVKRFIDIHPSPYHGLNMCLGTVAEMLEDPAREIFDVVQYFGERKKIFNIHFRNIIGKRDDFREVYPDNGDVDMLKLMRALRDVGYPYMVMPDHMPSHPDDPGGRQAFAFGFGYIKALIQAVNGEA